MPIDYATEKILRDTPGRRYHFDKYGAACVKYKNARDAAMRAEANMLALEGKLREQGMIVPIESPKPDEPTQ